MTTLPRGSASNRNPTGRGDDETYGEPLSRLTPAPRYGRPYAPPPYARPPQSERARESERPRSRPQADRPPRPEEYRESWESRPRSRPEQYQERRPQSRPGSRQDPRERRSRVPGLLTALVAAVSVSVIGYACVLAVHRQHALVADSTQVVSGISALVGSNAFASALSSADHTSKPPASPANANAPVTLTARDRTDCPPDATACVDLTEKITWLQADGKVSYGPVRMEPGTPGTVHATPTGTFHVAWKAGPTYMSTIYHELIPWAVFFAAGGIAFHEGSLTTSSHGCVHLTMADAYYYNHHLPIGAEVVVF